MTEALEILIICLLLGLASLTVYGMFHHPHDKDGGGTSSCC